jgi:hypothetical protein
VYRAVIAANEALEDYKYHLVGGAAGTVSPSKLCLCLFLAVVDTEDILLLLSNH